ncbi:adenine-specific methyltransferase EcoRI family protein [Streptococcus mutans]|uniref:Adenine methyltransferase n=1 Tax=Streptococcus mutans TaxID=1309 RepID=A0AAX1K1P4_STRMG|nr:adenine-specific methyltransferase EcoRI family protein [Streptococcus mutans]EMB77711.1 modification methylase (adenine-specificmethyltransferase) [Streptococcus mutans 5SM3]MBT3148500.1 adenine-specific methyltransferase EcoRI family protein [Streptococcus mutans]MBW3480153.1 adenine-specific methyltransferase EcoRI family protein [Streptococcus mutans]MCB4979523.1 adenine-specific methyltransferase EcoRI family protein [Streptococcus mutans]MDP5885785.1 adenine-specific methyltransferase
MASSLHNAKKVKNDEFFTRYRDIADEMGHYRDHFKNKIIYCNCDDPTQSNFWRYFHNNFTSLGLKKLIATHYQEDSEPSYALIYKGGDDFNMDAGDVVTIYGDDEYTAGDFRSQDSIKYLKEADIIVTNPPFSLFREYISQIMEYQKNFIVIGNKNSVTYKEIFPLFQNNQIWIGARNMNKDFWLYVPEGSEYEKLDEDGKKVKHIMACWYTNLDLEKRHDGLWHLGDVFDQSKAHKYYEGFEHKYPKYDNYDAINVNNVKDIPIDYKGAIGVPITYIDKFNPSEFEIIGQMANTKIDNYNFGYPFINNKRKYARILIKNLRPITKKDDKGY